MDAATFAAWTGGLLALLGILGVLFRLVKAGHRAARRLEHIEHLATELAPNGGGSIKDTVHRIEGKVDDNTKILSDHETRISRTEGQVALVVPVPVPLPPPSKD